MPQTLDLPGQGKRYAGKLLTSSGGTPNAPQQRGMPQFFRSLTADEKDDLFTTGQKVCELASRLDNWPTWQLVDEDAAKLLAAKEAAERLMVRLLQAASR